LTSHEVKYDYTDPNSDTYKVYINPVGSGKPEEWLNFQTKLRIVIWGNGLDENSLLHFNLSCTLLKDEAFHVFNEQDNKLTENKKTVRRTRQTIFCVFVQSQKMFFGIRHFNHRRAIYNT
jgi:hypothetical protein